MQNEAAVSNVGPTAPNRRVSPVPPTSIHRIMADASWRGGG